MYFETMVPVTIFGKVKSSTESFLYTKLKTIVSVHIRDGGAGPNLKKLGLSSCTARGLYFNFSA